MKVPLLDLATQNELVVGKFGEATGVPVLMNTSFNLRGEPIVGSPANAWNTFSKSGIDVLVLGKYVVRKWWFRVSHVLVGRLQKQKRKGLKNIVSGMMLSCASVVLTLLLLEGAVRVFLPQYLISDVIRPDPVLPFRFQENASGRMSYPGEFDVAVRINGQGLRADEDYTYAKPEGVVRIAILGDSMTFGQGVEASQAYPKVLESLLKAGKRECQVLNFGVFSWGPGEYYAYLKNDVLRYHPDIVAVGFFLGGDFFDTVNSKVVVQDGELVVNSSRSGGMLESRKFTQFIPFSSWLRGHSHLFRLAGVALFSPKEIVVSGYRYDLNKPYEDMLYSPHSNVFLRDDPQSIFSLNQAVIKAMAAAVNDTGGRFVVILIPESKQVKTASIEGLDYSIPNRAMADFLHAAGIPFVDATEALRRASDNAYYPQEGHLNPVGHRLVAEAVAELLVGILTESTR
jgi:lysophospholipase L1-like esterase